MSLGSWTKNICGSRCSWLNTLRTRVRQSTIACGCESITSRYDLLTAWWSVDSLAGFFVRLLELKIVFIGDVILSGELTGEHLGDEGVTACITGASMTSSPSSVKFAVTLSGSTESGKSNSRFISRLVVLHPGPDSSWRASKYNFRSTVLTVSSSGKYSEPMSTEIWNLHRSFI